MIDQSAESAINEGGGEVKPAKHRGPEEILRASDLVAGVGFEPTTSGL
jgi:hypothetical protein